MSLLEKLLEKGVEEGSDAIEDKGEEWLDDLLGVGRTFVDDGSEELGTLIGESAEDVVKAGHAALDELEANKQPFVRLGSVGFAFLVGHWENDDEAEARRRYIETQATYAERRAFMQAAGDAAQAERKEREEAWEQVQDVLKKIGTIGLKVLVKVVMKVAGI